MLGGGPSRTLGPRLLLAGLLLLALGSCEEHKPAASPPPVPVVTLAVVTEQVPVAVEEVGRAEASNSVTLLPRVGGQILARHFEEGQAVAAGDDDYANEDIALAARPMCLDKTRFVMSRKSESFARFLCTFLLNFPYLFAHFTYFMVF